MHKSHFQHHHFAEIMRNEWERPHEILARFLIGYRTSQEIRWGSWFLFPSSWTLMVLGFQDKWGDQATECDGAGFTLRNRRQTDLDRWERHMQTRISLLGSSLPEIGHQIYSKEWCLDSSKRISCIQLVSSVGHWKPERMHLGSFMKSVVRSNHCKCAWMIGRCWK